MHFYDTLIYHLFNNLLIDQLKFEPVNGKSEKKRSRHHKDHKKDGKHGKDNKSVSSTSMNNRETQKRPMVKMKKPPTQSFDEILQMARVSIYL